ncbi:MAG TPA: hypothetical protein VMU04_01945, partial [Candidatus Acidoferrum sp.]|nr:hypothetical protein [Candidatus Acidoferrum sp.]
PLLQAIKQAVLATPNFTAIARSNQDIQLDFQTQPLALYGVQRTSNLLSGVWTNVATNLTGTGSIMQVTDPDALAIQPSRFYRVRTPP